MNEDKMIQTLERLCDAYREHTESSDRFSSLPDAKQRYAKLIEEVGRLELAATEIGKELDAHGGIAEMRRVFSKLEGRRGSRTLEMHWGGIGSWQG